MIKYLVLGACLLLNVNVQAQKFVNVVDQTIIVNSSTNLTGSTRNVIDAKLPESTSSYVYRVTILQKDEIDQSTNLVDLLSQVMPSDVGLAAKLTQFVIKNGDSEAVDAFTFTNVQDAQNFRTKQDGNWQACSAKLNLVNAIYTTADCLNPTLYFGFRNNNSVTGLKVHLEIVAVVDDGAKTKYTYTLRSGLNQEVKFQLSADKVNWEDLMLQPGYQYSLPITTRLLHFRVYTSAFNFVTYEINPDDRYKIVWLNNKFDLVRY